MINFISNSLKRGLPFLCIAVIAGLLAAFELHNVNNWDYPLSGEYFISPFHGEILQRSLNIWDEHFGLGFSNLLNSPGEAQYAAGYSGAMWVVGNVLNTLFQWIGAAYFLNLVVSIFLLGAGVYWSLTNFQTTSKSVINNILLSIAIVILIQSTDFLITAAGSAGRFLAGQGLILFAFLQYRKLSRFDFQYTYSVNDLILLALSLATLLLFLNAYFLALALLVAFQGIILCAWTAGKRRNKIVIHYAKILTIFIVLMFTVYGYVIAPSFHSTGNEMMSGLVGRNDSPMPIPLIDLLRFFNNPISDRFGWAGIWLQFGLAFFGIVLAMFSSGMRRWAIVDLLTIIIFLFLAKGSAPPFPEVNHWLHVNIPFLRLMGSGYPYFGVVYTLLIYYLIYGLSHAYDITKKRLPHTGGYVAWLIVIIIIIMAVVRNDAYLSGDFGGRIRSIEYPTEYYSFKQVAEKNLQEGRAYYFPDDGAQIGQDFIYSPSQPLGCCFSLPFSSLFPININWSNFKKSTGYFGQTMAFLMKHYKSGDELARILANADTKYVVFDKTLKSTAPAALRMSMVRTQVRASRYFEFRPILSNRYIEVYENLRWQPATLEIKNITLTNDDPNIFLEALQGNSDISEASIVVSNAITLAQTVKLKYENILNRVSFYNSDELGMMLDLIHMEYEVKPNANSLKSDGTSWYSHNNQYQIQHTENYGGRFAGRHPIASNSAGAIVQYHKKTFPITNNKLFIRALVSPSAGSILVSVNGNNKVLNLRSDGYVGLQWFNLGDVKDPAGKFAIDIESLDVDRIKVIDEVVLIPESKLNSAMEVMHELLTGMHVDRIEKNDYLQWKKGTLMDDHRRANQIQKNNEIRPKKLSIIGHHFKLHDNFDFFVENTGPELINISEQKFEQPTSLTRAIQDHNFLRFYGGIHQLYMASADVGAGTYSLFYEIVSCKAISELTLSLRTAYVSSLEPIQIYGSNDAISWAKIRTITSDNEADGTVNLSGFASGKKKIYIKIDYVKVKESPNSVYLADIVIQGKAGDEEMHCSLPDSKSAQSPNTIKQAKYINAPYSRDGWLTQLPRSDGSVEIMGVHDKLPGILVINKSFDPNFRLGDIHPFNIGYGYSGFVKSGINNIVRHDWQIKYRTLLYVSLGFYLLILLAFIWHKIKDKK